MNILDLVAITPLFIELAVQTLVRSESMKGARGLRVLRSVRLIRLFRIFKLGKYSSGMKLMLDALRNSVQPLSILMFFLCIGVVLFSSLLFYAEKVSCPKVDDPLL